MTTANLRETIVERTRALDPLTVFGRLTDEGTRADTVLLESAGGPEHLVRRSLIFHDPCVRIVGRGRLVQFSALAPGGRPALAAMADALEGKGRLEMGDGKLTFESPAVDPAPSDAARLRQPAPTDALRAAAFGWRADADVLADLRLPGVFSYDFVEQFEELPDYRSGEADYPDFVFWLPQTYVEIDHRSDRSRVCSFEFGAIERERRSSIAGERLVQTVDAIEGIGRAAAVPNGESTTSPEATADISDAAYAETVADLKEAIDSGEVFQVVPSRTFRAPCDDPLAAYRRLRSANPSPYLFFARRRDDVLFGASPETAVRVDPESRRVCLRPIAGTRERGRDEHGDIDPDRDARMELDLRLDPKEQSEHAMLVDLARNDVGRVSRAGTVSVDRLMGVDRFSRVMHLVSEVSGVLESDLDALNAYTASMNMGTLVGAPKIRAAQLLREREPNPRGPYGGGIGYLSGDGGMDTAIVIRSALVRDGQASVRAGAGIVADSQPMAEARETRAKADAVLRALQGESPRSADVGGPEPVDSAVQVLLVDNFDSFSFNLRHAFERAGAEVTVWRNDAPAHRVTAKLEAMEGPRLLLLSPGPGRPSAAGCCPEVVERLAGEVPMLGVCLGHQVIVEAFGGRVGRGEEPVHGRSSAVEHDGSGIFKGLPSPLRIGRYHSLVASRLPAELACTATVSGRATDNEPTVMGVRHNDAPVVGLQFHPESLLSPRGDQLVRNVLDWVRDTDAQYPRMHQSQQRRTG